MAQPTEYLFKTLVIGDPGIGKSSIIRQYVNGEFKHGYLFTIGVDFALKVLDLGNNEKVKLQLWDVAGQERFNQMTRVYYKEATACIIVFDITQRRTFQSVARWKNDLDSKVHLPNGKPVPCLLLANKCDLKPRPVPDEEIDRLCKDLGFVGWFPTSAKDNVNIDKAIRLLVNRILEEGSYTMPTHAQRSGVITVVDEKMAPVEKPEDSNCVPCFK